MAFYYSKADRTQCLDEDEAKMEKERNTAREGTDPLSRADAVDESNAETRHMIIAGLGERIGINRVRGAGIRFRIRVEQ